MIHLQAPRGHMPKGGTGFGAELLLAYLKQRAEYQGLAKAIDSGSQE
jgi:hypothetical protein